ncbi:hypothetical protein GINT2_000617 [Glugoides intestinalis]
MTATETTTQSFDNISGELTLKEVLSMNIFGSLFNTAMFIVASIFIFLAIIWLYYRNYYFKALGIMKTMGLLVFSGILFGVTFKVLLTTIRVLAGSYGCVNCSNVKLTLVVTVSIMFLSLSLLFRKESHKNIGLLPKQATATNGPVGKDATVGPVEPTSQAALNAQAQAQAVRDAQAAFNAQADLAEKAAQEKAQADLDAQAALDALAKAAQAKAQADLDAQAAKAALDALDEKAAQAVFEQAALDEQAAQAKAQAAQAVFKQAAFDEKAAQAKAQAAQAVFKQAALDEQAALEQVKAARAALAQAKAALYAQKTPQGQTVVSASLPTAENN